MRQPEQIQRCARVGCARAHARGVMQIDHLTAVLPGDLRQGAHAWSRVLRGFDRAGTVRRPGQGAPDFVLAPTSGPIQIQWPLDQSARRAGQGHRACGVLAHSLARSPLCGATFPRHRIRGRGAQASLRTQAAPQCSQAARAIHACNSVAPWSGRLDWQGSARTWCVLLPSLGHGAALRDNTTLLGAYHLVLQARTPWQSWRTQDSQRILALRRRHRAHRRGDQRWKAIECVARATHRTRGRAKRRVRRNAARMQCRLQSHQPMRRPAMARAHRDQVHGIASMKRVPLWSVRFVQAGDRGGSAIPGDPDCARVPDEAQPPPQRDGRLHSGAGPLRPIRRHPATRLESLPWP